MSPFIRWPNLVCHYTTLWVYKGSGDPYANPLSDVDWSRLAKVKDLTPGELT
ncbi:phage tail tube protein, partial [Escherichia coli]